MWQLTQKDAEMYSATRMSNDAYGRLSLKETLDIPCLAFAHRLFTEAIRRRSAPSLPPGRNARMSSVNLAWGRGKTQALIQSGRAGWTDGSVGDSAQQRHHVCSADTRINFSLVCVMRSA